VTRPGVRKPKTPRAKMTPESGKLIGAAGRQSLDVQGLRANDCEPDVGAESDPVITKKAGGAYSFAYGGDA